MSGLRNKKIFRAFVVSLAVIFVAMLPVAVNPETTQAEISKVRVTPEYMQTIARSQLPMINSWRAGTTWYYDSSNTKVYKNGLKALKYDFTLEKYAMQRAAEVIISFEHKRPNRQKSGLGQFGYIGNGENIAVTMDPRGIDAKHIFELFKEDEYPYSGQGHRRNMLSAPYSWDCVGIACVRYNDCYYWVQTFGMTDKPDTTATPAINAFKNMTVEIDPSILESKTADLYQLDDWDAKVKKGQTVMLPAVALGLMTSETFPQWVVTVYGIPTWTSTNSGVVSVDSDRNTMTGVNEGSASVTMKEPITGANRTTSVTVYDPDAVTGVSLDKTSLSMNTGASATLKATVSPSTASNKNVTWSSSNTSVATVSSTGVVKAVKAGTATITAKTVSGNKTATCKITVKDVIPTGVSLNKTNLTVEAGKTQKLTATITPTNATNKNLVWSSNKTSVATVSGGTVKGVAPGNAVITVKTSSGGKTATCNVVVELYYRNASGNIDTSYTGMAKVDSKWRYFTKGKFDSSYTGIAKHPVNGKWYYMKNGVLNTSFTGIAKHPENSKWYYVKNGSIDFTYTGMAAKSANEPAFGKWYHCNKGIFVTSYNGLDLSPVDGKWHYMKKGILNATYTGMAKHPADGLWHYCKNGVLDESFTGVVTHSNGKSYYMINGKLDTGFNGNITYNGIKYKVTKGTAVPV